MTLDKFTASYIEAALWSSMDESTPEGGEQTYELFYSTWRITALAGTHTSPSVLPSERPRKTFKMTGRVQPGHDFWLTRCSGLTLSSAILLGPSKWARS